MCHHTLRPSIIIIFYNTTYVLKFIRNFIWTKALIYINKVFYHGAKIAANVAKYEKNKKRIWNPHKRNIGAVFSKTILEPIIRFTIPLKIPLPIELAVEATRMPFMEPLPYNHGTA